MDVNSEKLIILPDDDVMYTDLPALVIRGQSRMHGVGMKYNNKTTQLEVFSASNVEINNNDMSGSSKSSAPKNTGPAPQQKKP
jgi:lipopolysaccharide export system protein LptC